jgi:hypothetical protein
MLIQALLTAAAVNLKRLAAALLHLLRSFLAMLDDPTSPPRYMRVIVLTAG